MTHPHWTYKTPEWVIFDLDGTLAEIKHRLHMIKQPPMTVSPEEGVLKTFKPDWDAFNMACDKDMPKQHVIELLRMAQHYGKSIAIFTGRMETARERTIEWLRRHDIKYDVLEMRKSKDYRSDTDVKKEMFFKHFNTKQIWFVADDRDNVVNLWRELGLTCFQVQKGDY